MEPQQPIGFEAFFAELTFEWSFLAVSSDVAVQVLLCFELFGAIFEGAMEVEGVTVGRLVALHVGLLDESFAAMRAFVRFFAGVELHMAVEAELFGEVLVADLANVAFASAVSVWRVLASFLAQNRLAKHQRPDQQVFRLSTLHSVLLNSFLLQLCYFFKHHSGIDATVLRFNAKRLPQQLQTIVQPAISIQC